MPNLNPIGKTWEQQRIGTVKRHGVVQNAAGNKEYG